VVAPLGSFWDKLRLVRLRAHAGSGSLEELFSRPHESTHDRLRRLEFSQEFVEAFFRPFLGGVFLEHELATSSRKLEFVVRMVAQGEVVVPALGMEEIGPARRGLPEGALRTGTPVARVHPQAVELESGDRIDATAVVVATDGVTAARLVPAFTAPHTVGVTAFSFEASEPPVRGPWLLLDGENRGPVNHAAVMSEVAPEYAPPGKALVSASVLGAYPDVAELELRVRAQLRTWFGSAVDGWRLVRADVVPDALPVEPPRCSSRRSDRSAPRPASPCAATTATTPASTARSPRGGGRPSRCCPISASRTVPADARGARSAKRGGPMRVALVLRVFSVPRSPPPRRAGVSELRASLDQFVPTPIVVDLTRMPEAERRALARLVQAARLMDPLFLRQVWAGNEALLMRLAADPTPLGQARLRFFLLNSGPWDRQAHDAPFIPGVPPRPAPANFYPRRHEGGGVALDVDAHPRGADAGQWLLHHHPPSPRRWPHRGPLQPGVPG
jgi:hypothetical protein